MAQTGSVILDGVGKDYEVGEGLLQVLNGVDLEIAAGSDVVITGPSGTGKSTLLHLLGALERPSRGTIRVNGRDLAPLSDDEVASFRNREVGFVFQDHHLLPQFSVLQNVVLPSVAACSRGMSSADGESAEARARRLLEAVGLSDRLEHRPAQLSGGERQRAAIARSLINQPSLLLCDEPTGNLDAATADRVSDLLFEMHRLASEASGASLVTVTHSTELAARFSRRLVVTAAGQLDDVTGRAGE